MHFCASHRVFTLIALSPVPPSINRDDIFANPLVSSRASIIVFLSVSMGLLSFWSSFWSVFFYQKNSLWIISGWWKLLSLLFISLFKYPLTLSSQYFINSNKLIQPSSTRSPVSHYKGLGAWLYVLFVFIQLAREFFSGFQFLHLPFNTFPLWWTFNDLCSLSLWSIFLID